MGENDCDDIETECGFTFAESAKRIKINEVRSIEVVLPVRFSKIRAPLGQGNVFVEDLFTITKIRKPLNIFRQYKRHTLVGQHGHEPRTNSDSINSFKTVPVNKSNTKVSHMTLKYIPVSPTVGRIVRRNTQVNRGNSQNESRKPETENITEINCGKFKNQIQNPKCNGSSSIPSLSKTRHKSGASVISKEVLESAKRKRQEASLLDWKSAGSSMNFGVEKRPCHADCIDIRRNLGLHKEDLFGEKVTARRKSVHMKLKQGGHLRFSTLEEYDVHQRAEEYADTVAPCNDYIIEANDTGGLQNWIESMPLPRKRKRTFGLSDTHMIPSYSRIYPDYESYVTGDNGVKYLRPPTKLVELVAKAINDSPDGMLQVQQVYTVLQKRYPYFQFMDKSYLTSWRSSIRHALYQKWFKKIQLVTDLINCKGCYWMINRKNTPKEWELPDKRKEHLSLETITSDDERDMDMNTISDDEEQTDDYMGEGDIDVESLPSLPAQYSGNTPRTPGQLPEDSDPMLNDELLSQISNGTYFDITDLNIQESSTNVSCASNTFDLSCFNTPPSDADTFCPISKTEIPVLPDPGRFIDDTSFEIDRNGFFNIKEEFDFSAIDCTSDFVQDDSSPLFAISSEL